MLLPVLAPVASVVLLIAGVARADGVPVRIEAGETAVTAAQVQAELAAQLGRPVTLVESLPPAGEAVDIAGVGREAVDVRCRDGQGQTRARRLAISSRPADAAREVALLAAELLSAGLPPGPDAGFAGEIEGRVVGAQGEPVVEARLELASPLDAGVESTDTDQLGRFRIPPVAYGSYLLRVHADGFEPLERTLPLAAPLRGLTLQLRPNAPAAVPTFEIEGQVRGPDSEPVPEAKLVVVDSNRIPTVTTDTDQAGRFRLPDVPAGRYSLQVDAPGYVSRTMPLEVRASVHDLDLALEAQGAASYHTTVMSDRAPLPAQDGTSSTVVSQRDIEGFPGGSTRQLNDVVSTQPGIIQDNFGAMHVRGNFAGVQLRVDGVQLPPAIQNRLQELLDPQIIQEAKVIVGGLPAEFGEDVAAVIDIKTRHPDAPFEGESQLTYGSYSHVEEQANVAGKEGPFSFIAAGMLQTTDRGLDPEAVTPILHDQLHEGRAFLRLDDNLTANDRLELLGVYSESHYQIPIDPTVLPLSAGPANAVRGTDQYGNDAPDFVPYDSDPTELEREMFAALSYFHDFDSRTQLQITPFFRYQQSNLVCDEAHQLGAAADPGQGCSDVNHQVVQGGLQINQSIGIGVNDFKLGLLVDDQRSSVAYTQFTRLDSPVPPATFGADPALTLVGEDDINTLLAGLYFQDRIKLGKLTLFPGVRLDLLHVGLQTPQTTKWLVGPSFRLGAAYAFSDEVVVHAFIGRLWAPPSFDAPAAARILGAVPPDAPVPFDLVAEEDNYAEIGVAVRVIPQLTLSLTPWVRFSTNTIDDEEIGDTALTADYNYANGRAWGAELAANLVIRKNLRAFGNFGYQVSEGEGINSSTYLFSREQLNFTGYQATDNAQQFTANVGVDLSDTEQTTHLTGLMRYGSGLRTGPTNNATLPPTTIVDLTLRHRFAFGPFKPEVALDVRNLFNVVYAYRISTGSLSGTSYGSLREFDVRLIIPFGS